MAHPPSEYAYRAYSALVASSPFGDALRRRRKEQGLSQGELGGRVGVGQQAVSAWEGGTSEPDITTLTAIAAALETNAASLLDGYRTIRPHLTVVEEPTGTSAVLPLPIGLLDADDYRRLLDARIQHGPLTNEEVAFFRELATTVRIPTVRS